MGFSIAVWNIKHFRYHASRVRAVGELIRAHDPDVIGILEFLDKGAARRLVRSAEFEPYDFAFTDSKQGIEILVGWRRGRFAQALYTQRRDLQVGQLTLRPGGLLSLLEPDGGPFTNLLFLHADSGTREADHANRQALFRKIWSLHRALKRLPEQQGQARLIALGDLNTMGWLPGGPDGAGEIAALRRAASRQGLRLLPKSHDRTWSNPSGSLTSDLDHVLASKDLAFATLADGQSEVRVDGWVNRSGQARRNFLANISDHSLLITRLV